MTDELKPTPRSRRDVEKVARQTLQQAGMLSVPVDPIAVAKANGIRVFTAKFADDSISGMLARRGPSITMLINASDSAMRKRFTIAHELGHRILGHFTNDMEEHSDRAEDLFRTAPEDPDKATDSAEVQANQFAAALLMPEDFVRNHHVATKDVDALAKIFRVSEAAMGFRLSALRLI